MLSDDTFEDQLRLQFSMLDVPVPSAGAFEKAIRRFRRWRLRRRLLIATPGVVAAASLGVALGLGGGIGPGSGGSSSSNAIHPSDHNAIHLANYAFHLPSGFHVTAAATSACQAVVTFGEKMRYTPGSVPKIARIITGAGPYSTVKIASAANANGGCVEMALTRPFTPTAATENPYLGLTASTSSARQVDVAGYVGWLTTVGTNEGQPALQLTVELQQGNGQMRDLGVGASGFSASELLTIVSHGLS